MSSEISDSQNLKKKKIKRILLSGGGTGGHIYPALAVAQEFKSNNPGVDIRFVGSARGLETKIIPEKGYKLYLLKIGPLHNSVGRVQQLKTFLLLPFVVLQCLWILIRFRPQLVVGFGGYASAPVVFLASLLFFKTAIWEANVQPGIANKVLARFVKRCFVVFEESLGFFPKLKTKCFGYPVRAEFDELYKSKSKIDLPSMRTPLNDSRVKVLIFGGSQGARIFNDLIPKIALAFPKLEFHLQTGLKNYDATLKKINELKIIDSYPNNLKVYPFLDPIVDFYLSSDLVICRSGAGAVAELAALGAKCLFVPFAYASDNHQYKNALALSQRGAAHLIEEKNLNEESLKYFLNDFLAKYDDEQRQMSQRMLAFFKPNATKNIVDELVQLKRKGN